MKCMLFLPAGCEATGSGAPNTEEKVLSVTNALAAGAATPLLKPKPHLQH